MKDYVKMAKRVVGIALLLYFIIWLIFFIVFLFVGHVSSFMTTLLSYSVLIIMAPFFIGIMGGLACIAVTFMRFFIKNSSVAIKIISWIVIIGVITISIGGCIYYFGTPSTLFGEYDVSNVMVVEQIDGKIVIDYTEFNNGDYATISIPKPFYVKVMPNDYISVRYPVDNPKKMRYVISASVGLDMIATGFVMIIVWLYLAIILLCVSIPYNIVTKRKKTKVVKEKMEDKSTRLKKRKAKRRLIDKSE